MQDLPARKRPIRVVRQLDHDAVDDKLKQVSDELGTLTGRFLDVSNGVALQQGRDQDEANAHTRRILAHVLAIGTTVVTGTVAPGAGTLAKLVISSTRREISSWGLKTVFPTDHELGASEDWRHAIGDPATRLAFRVNVMAALFDEAPEYFDPVKVPEVLVFDGHLVPPDGQGFGFCPPAGVWEAWWEEHPLVNEDIRLQILDMENAFVAWGDEQSHPANGPNLPFTDP